MAKFSVCSIPDCGKPTKSGVCPYCHRHYRINLRHGDPLIVKKKHSAPGEPYRWLLEHSKHEGNECLEWPFAMSHWGYGFVQVGKQKRVASRVMCEVAHGAPPTTSHEAAHFCGNGKCINPNHLRWATPSENQMDRVAHETSNRGKRHGLSKLTPDQVKQIRHLAKTGVPLSQIAVRMGISPSHAGGIARGDFWSWLP